jgi:hypothetical protein
MTSLLSQQHGPITFVKRAAAEFTVIDKSGLSIW